MINNDFLQRAYAAVVGSENAHANVSLGMVLTSVAKWTFRSMVSGVALTLAPMVAKMGNTVGTVLTTRVASATVKPPQTVGLVLSTTPTTPVTPPGAKAVAGAQITQHTIKLVRDIGANAATQSGAVNGGWVNIANATGLPDGTKATLTHSLTAPPAGQIDLTYVDADSTKNRLTIVSAILKFTVTQVGTVLGNGKLALKYETNAIALNTLQTSTADVAAPQSFDITAAVLAGSAVGWANLAGLKTHVFASDAATDLTDCTCDAVELIVTTATLVTNQ